MDRHHVVLSWSARSLLPSLLMLAGFVALAIGTVLLGVPSVDDVGSWRWTVVRPG